MHHNTTIGSPQGDGLSPVLFKFYFAAALSSVRESSTRPNTPISSMGMPLEMEYADDVDFIDEEKQTLEDLLLTIGVELQDVNLFIMFMNKSKTEFTQVFLANSGEMSEILGSLLCSSSYITARCIMRNIAFHFYWKLWIRGSNNLLKTRNTPLWCNLYVTHAVQLQQLGNSKQGHIAWSPMMPYIRCAT